MRVKPFILLLLVLSISSEAKAVKCFRYTQFNVNDGLTQSSVYSIGQDQKGYIWCGTGEGLNKLRGIEIENYYWQQNGPFRLIDNSIREIHLADDGTLYFGSDRGIIRYELMDTQFHRTDYYASHRHHDFRVLFSTEQFIWMTMNRKDISRIDRRTQKRQVYNFPIGNWDSKPRAANGFIYYRNETGDTLLGFDCRTGQFSVNPLPFCSSSLQIAANGSVYLLHGKTIYKWDKKLMRSFIALQFGFEPVSDFFLIDRQGRFWIHHPDEGIRAYNSTGDLLYVNAPDETRIRYIYRMFEDRNGNIWVGTDGLGLLKIPVGSLHFHTLQSENGSVLKGFIKSLHSDRSGNLYTAILQQRCVYKHDATGKFLACIPLNIPGAEDISGIYALGTDQLLIATTYGLFYRDANGRVYKVSKLEGVKRFRKYNNQIWVTGLTGLAVIDIRHGIPKELSVHWVDKIAFRSFIVSGNDLLIGGLNNSDLVKFDFRRTNLTTEILKGFEGIRVNDISLLADSTFLLSTNSGLFHTDSNFNILSKYDRRNGLSDYYIYGVLAENDSIIWGSTNKGLFRLNLSTGIVINFNQDNGLASEEFNSGVFHATSVGNFYFGGIDGVTYFKSSEQISEPGNCPVYLKSFNAGDRQYSIPASGVIKLKWNDTRIVAELDQLDYLDNGSAELWVKLEGVKKAQWEFLGKKRVYRVGNLESGKYTFRVRQKNGTRFIEKELIQFLIATPFWKQVWFVMGSVLLSFGFIIGVSIFLTRRRHLSRIRELERETQLQEIRKGIYRDLHDEIGSGLTRISMLSELATGNSEKSDILPTLKETSVEITRKLRDIVWGMKSENEQFIEVALRLQQIGQEATDTAAIDFLFTKQIQHTDAVLNPELIRNLIMVYREALNNSIKHSGAKQIDVSLLETNKLINLRLCDNGSGILLDRLDPRTQNGISIMKDRIHKLGGTFNLNSPPEGGTCIDIHVPI